MSTGYYVVFLDHDDLIAPNLFFEAADKINYNKNLDIIYYDEDKISLEGVRCDPFFKPKKHNLKLFNSLRYKERSSNTSRWF